MIEASGPLQTQYPAPLFDTIQIETKFRLTTLQNARTGKQRLNRLGDMSHTGLPALSARTSVPLPLSHLSRSEGINEPYPC
jgi:hypothetical protein